MKGITHEILLVNAEQQIVSESKQFDVIKQSPITRLTLKWLSSDRSEDRVKDRFKDRVKDRFRDRFRVRFRDRFMKKFRDSF